MVIGITEVKAKNSATSLSPAEFTMEWNKGYTLFHTNIENDTGRGLLLYVHESLKVEEIKLATKFQENIFVQIHTNNHDKLLLGLVYRSPSDNSDTSNFNLRNIVNEAASMNPTHFLLMGDFNYPQINWDTMTTRNEGSEEQKFIDCLQDNYLFQCVSKPTRWRGTDDPHILDLIITNNLDCIEGLEYNSPLGKSDHCVILFEVVCQTLVISNTKERKCYKKAQYSEIKKSLLEVDWKNFLSEGVNNVQEAWLKFHTKLSEIENKYVPTVKIKSGKMKQFPLDSQALSAIKEKTALSRKFIRTKDKEVRKQYNRARNKVSKLVKRARKQYENTLASETKSNPKRIWQYINAKSKIKQGIGDLCSDPRDEKSKKTDNNEEKSDILANYFSSVFTHEPAGEPPTLEARQVEVNWSNMIIQEIEIAKLLKNLKPDKSPGLDNIHPTFLKELHQELATPLSIIFNKSLSEKQIPKEWKKAKISAIFKKGSKSLASNYRPVSLTSVVCKVMEKIIRNHIVKFMTINNHFTKKQYGFMAGRSTALQLLKVIDEWTEAIDNGCGIDCIYMDYQKAFDTVPHRRLIEKLKAYGIGPNIIEWIEDFLSSRKQQVSVGGHSSKWHNVSSGIPQGSVLGPLLFIIFINDLPDVVDSTVYLFADDTKIFNLIKSKEDKLTLQKDLDKLSQWTNKWLLKLHPEKCKCMNIGRINPDPEFKYTLCGKELQAVDEEKDIGVYIDRKLSFDHHISEKVKKANSMFAVLRRSFNHLDENIFAPLYKSLVRTHLEYASSVWAPFKMKHIEMLEKVQRRATRQLPGLANLSYQDRLKKLKLPSLVYRRYRGDMIEVFKILTGKYDTATDKFLKLRSECTERQGGRGNSMKLYAQRSRLELRKNSFGIRTAHIWNSLPDVVINANTVNSFKNRLDKYWKTQEVLYDYKATLRTGTKIVSLEDIYNEESSKEEPNGPALEIYAK